MMGVINPVGVATATEISAFLYLHEIFSKKELRIGNKNKRSDDLSQPGRVGLWNVGKSTGDGFHDEIVDAQLGALVLVC